MFNDVQPAPEGHRHWNASTSGVAKVGNGWAQAQPIISSAQPIFMSIVQPIYAPFHIKIYNKYSLYNTQITHFEFFVVVCVGYF